MFARKNEFLANFGDIPREEAFAKTVDMAFANMLGGRDPMDMTDDEIRASLNEYYTRYVPSGDSPGG